MTKVTRQRTSGGAHRTSMRRAGWHLAVLAWLVAPARARAQGSPEPGTTAAEAPAVHAPSSPLRPPPPRAQTGAPAAPAVPASQHSDGPADPAAAPAHVLGRPALELIATIDPSARRLSGTATWTLANHGERPLRELLFWLYPNRLAKRAPSLGDVNYHWLYPDGFSPASITVQAVRAGLTATPLAAQVEASSAGEATVLRVSLPAPLAPGAATRIALDFVTELPHRLGNFGCASTQCRLMGGFYPFPLAQGPAGFVVEAAPDRIDYRAQIEAPTGSDVVLGDTVAPVARGPVASSSTDAPYVTLVVDRGMHVEPIAAGGFRARYLHRETRPPSSEDQLLPYVREDRAGLIMDAAADALAFLAAQGLGGPADDATPLTLIEAPLRNDLVTRHGQVILVSDRLLEIFPIERVRKYHRLELVRAVLAAALDHAMRGIEPDPDVALSEGLIAAYLADNFTLNRFRRLEFARDLLRPLAFLPAVDQLIYAPLLASSASYFGDVEDRDVLRDDIRRFSHHQPGPRYLYAKLVDLVGPQGVAQIARLVVGERVPLRQAAARVFGAPLDWFWRQWLSGPPPRVNYRLASVRTSPLVPRGAHVVIDVERQGADLLEPVEVRVTDRDHVAHDLIWRERGQRHRFEVDLPAGLSSVELDPRHRLTESAVGSLTPADDPRLDNRVPKRWRLLYDGFGALLDVSALQLAFAGALTLKPQHDLRNSFDFLVARNQSTNASVSASYQRLFGHQADPNRLTSGFGGGISVARPNATYAVAAGAPPEPGWRLSADLVFQHDDRDYFIDPWHAFGLELDAGYTLTALENGERFSQFFASTELKRLIELAPAHVLGFDFKMSGTLGDIRKRSQLYMLGGAGGLRGYGVNELPGRARGLARVELRDQYVADLDWNLGHFTSVRGLGGNVFFEAGAISSCDDFSVGKDDLFYDVGYTFRVLHDAFGVYQQLLAIDVAVPLNRHDRVCLGQHALGSPQAGQATITRPSFVVLISFLPIF